MVAAVGGVMAASWIKQFTGASQTADISGGLEASRQVKVTEVIREDVLGVGGLPDAGQGVGGTLKQQVLVRSSAFTYLLPGSRHAEADKVCSP
jgi:hypothetical protein